MAGKYNYFVFSFSCHGTQFRTRTKMNQTWQMAFCPTDLVEKEGIWDLIIS